MAEAINWVAALSALGATELVRDTVVATLGASSRPSTTATLVLRSLDAGSMTVPAAGMLPRRRPGRARRRVRRPAARRAGVPVDHRARRPVRGARGRAAGAARRAVLADAGDPGPPPAPTSPAFDRVFDAAFRETRPRRSTRTPDAAGVRAAAAAGRRRAGLRAGPPRGRRAGGGRAAVAHAAAATASPDGGATTAVLPAGAAAERADRDGGHALRRVRRGAAGRCSVAGWSGRLRGGRCGGAVVRGRASAGRVDRAARHDRRVRGVPAWSRCSTCAASGGCSGRARSRWSPT